MLTLRLGGDRPTLVYPKPDFEPATYTILNFPVDDIDAAVDELIARGVAFELYDGFEQDERGIARGDGPADRLVPRPGGQHPRRHRGVRARIALWAPVRSGDERIPTGQRDRRLRG